MFQLHEKINRGGIYIIAEMSANHAGKLERAMAIVEAAKEAGADCLKIQTYTADTITIDCDAPCFQIHGGLWDGYNLHDLYMEAFTPWEWQPRIKEYCEKLGLDFLSTPFDSTAVDFLSGMNCEAYKVASFELVDIPLIEYAARLGKTMIISCGMGTKEEIQDALKACHRVGNDDVVLLKCCSEYPTNPENLNLATLTDMQAFGVPLGLSDHSMGYIADVMAVAQGACVIEKHFCLSRQEKSQDSAFSMEPAEFKAMVDAVQKAALMRGKVQYGPTEAEAEEYKCRRSLFAVQDIPAGTILTNENVRSIRPYDGLPPKYLPQVLGKTAKVDIAFGTPLSWELVE
ncbi:putative N-acetylneuraminate synthase [Selenomonas ruminantium subsp. lactilytica TAM6421]|uniref:Putative N-acetylneuraminate synthase n=1 Tax=Selenomonas ruminantium subsp. lactilytica (strain NBRC 103574 / TAM6421) TaxID=927704 RepID=I0GTJ3_SELRL|nr:pseudaminic acid synthase [Selenomonas ruminantium]BAL84080.1 putative N-acetylneuraminate synthase [Selenomonas ruminantium subsp. lactilytica TAM6421]